MNINLVLVEPEIPQNTGNIARTCAATGLTLHLVKPLGFSVEDKYLKRAGLDYWHLTKVIYHESLDDFFKIHPVTNCFMATTKAKKLYCEIKYPEEVFFIFGKESAGLPESLLKRNLDRCIRIPMIKESRSLNLSNAAAILAFEALRQQDFPNLKQQGKLTQEL